MPRSTHSTTIGAAIRRLTTTLFVLATVLGACATPPTLPETDLPVHGPSLRVPPHDSATARDQRSGASGIADGKASV